MNETKRNETNAHATRSANTELCYPTGVWHLILWFAPIMLSFVWMTLCYLGIFYKLLRSRGRGASLTLAKVPLNAGAKRTQRVAFLIPRPSHS